MQKKFFLYDDRYHADPFKATLFEACDTIEEARENAPEYGASTVIVEATVRKTEDRKYEVVSEKIVQ